MADIYVFGNGNLSFENFMREYAPVLEQGIKNGDHERVSR